jgi:ABC-type nitrate/sulfonate/bicarbonate transport system substrate-binding protein
LDHISRCGRLSRRINKQEKFDAKMKQKVYNNGASYRRFARPPSFLRRVSLHLEASEKVRLLVLNLMDLVEEMRVMARPTLYPKKTIVQGVLALLFLTLNLCFAQAAEMPLVRIAYGAFNEKILALWLGREQGFFRKQGANVELIAIRTGGQTVAALASGDVQMAFTIPGSVLSAFAGGIDVAFFGGIVNRADGDFVVAPSIRRAEDLKGKKLGVQSIGGGVWSLSMLALEHLGLEPTRDKITLLVLGDQAVLTQAMATGRIDAAYLGYTFSALLKEKGFPVLLDIGRAPIPYQGLALAARRSYLKQNPQVVDSILRGVLESVAFIQNPIHREVVVRSLAKNLRLTNAKDAESGYEVLQWLYSLDIRPNAKGIQNMQRLLAMTNPKVAGVKLEDVVYEAAVERIQQSAFYDELVSRSKR